MTSSAPASERPPCGLKSAEWGSSAAKRLTGQDMLDGLVLIDEKIRDPKQLHEELCAHQPEFSDFPFDLTRHKDRFARIQAAVKRLRWSADCDKECFDEFGATFPQQTHGPTGKPLWKDSEADHQLKQAMQADLHLQISPGESFATNPIWASFGKSQFSERIDQSKEAAKPCGANPMQATAKKKRKDQTEIKDRPTTGRVGGVAAHNNSSQNKWQWQWWCHLLDMFNVDNDNQKAKMVRLWLASMRLEHAQCASARVCA